MENNEINKAEAAADEIYEGFQIFERENQAPAVECNESHTVLFNLPLPEDPTIQPIPRSGDDVWDETCVRLPSSQSCKYSEIDEEGNTNEKLRWELIKSSLTETSINNSRELEKVIKKYNTKFADEWDFKLLHELFEDDFSEDDSEYFFDIVMPKVIELALRLSELITSPIPLLKKRMNHSVSLSQEQAACILANAFLCTFPKRNAGRHSSTFPEINFNRLFSSNGAQVIEKTKCLLNYFKRVVCNEMPKGVLTYQRRYIEPANFPDWSECETKFSSIKLGMSSEQKIEDGEDMLQVDFANSYLGGGVLGWGCVQEEIRFVINPEMIVGMLFCESMRPEEAIIMTGCEQFNKYWGYSKSFKWHGNVFDKTQQDKFRRKKTCVVAIDALSFHKPHLQFEDFALKREMNKAFVGYFHDSVDVSVPIPVCSGNWGCGAYRGFKPLKALIQLMACCVNRRNLFYCTFGEIELMTQINEMFNFLTKNDITVGTIWNDLKSFKTKKLSDDPNQLYPFIYRQKEKREFQLNVADSDLDEDELKELEKTEETNKIENVEQKVDCPMESAVESPTNPPLKRPRIVSKDEQEIVEKVDKMESLCKNLNEHLNKDPSEQPAQQDPIGEVQVEKSKSRKITDFYKPT